MRGNVKHILFASQGLQCQVILIYTPFRLYTSLFILGKAKD